MFSLNHVHPMMVHFPIVFLITGFVAEVVYKFFRRNELFETSAFWLLIFGSMSAVVAYFTGAFMTRDLNGIAGSVQSTHELYAELTVAAALITAIIKIYVKTEGKENRMLSRIGFAFYAISVLLVCITGFYGGVLVYNYMIPK